MEKKKFYIIGRAIPERANIWIETTTFQTSDYLLTFRCDSSQINICIETNNPTITEAFAFSAAKEITTILVASLGFTLNYGYGAELISSINESGDSTTYHVGYNEEHPKHNEQFGEIAEYCVKDIYLRYAVIDFTKAITASTDIAFLCYRAIETIKAKFGDDGKGWQIMHAALQTTKAEIDEIKAFADPVRHGNYSTFPDEAPNIDSMLLKTKEIIMKYFEYLKRQNHTSV